MTLGGSELEVFTRISMLHINDAICNIAINADVSILLFTLIVIWQQIYNWLLSLNLIYNTLRSGTGSSSTIMFKIVYFLPLSPQKFLVLTLSTLEGWKGKPTFEPPSGFEHETPRLGIQHLNHYAIATYSNRMKDC